VNDLATVNARLAKEWDPLKNAPLIPSDVLPGTAEKAWWLCDAGHSWPASVKARHRGAGCPTCSTSGTSRIEKAVLHVMAPILQEREGARRIPLTWRNSKSATLDVSGKWRQSPVAVEYDGEHFHRKSQLRDVAKTRALLDAGWTVIRIREGSLGPLLMNHERLLQLTHIWRPGSDADMANSLVPLQSTVHTWLESRGSLPDVSHLPHVSPLFTAS
jgi:hypothetical protein